MFRRYQAEGAQEYKATGSKHKQFLHERSETKNAANKAIDHRPTLLQSRWG